MAIRLYCGKCGKKFRIDQQYAGQVGECSRCNARIPIPYSDLESVTMRLFCDFCHEGIKVDEERAQTKIACPKCSARISLPPLNLTDEEFSNLAKNDPDTSSDSTRETAEVNHGDEGSTDRRSDEPQTGHIPKVQMKWGGVGRPEQYASLEPSESIDGYVGDQRRKKTSKRNVPSISDNGGAKTSARVTEPPSNAPQPTTKSQTKNHHTVTKRRSSLRHLMTNPRVWISIIVVLVCAVSTSGFCCILLARSIRPKIARPPMAGLNVTVRAASDARSLPILRCWETEVANAKLTLAPLPKTMRALFSEDVAILLLIINNKHGNQIVQYDPKLRPVRLVTADSEIWSNLDLSKMAKRRLSKRSVQLFRAVDVSPGRGNWRLIAFESEMDFEHVEKIHLDMSGKTKQTSDAENDGNVMKERHHSVYEIMEMFRRNG